MPWSDTTVCYANLTPMRNMVTARLCFEVDVSKIPRPRKLPDAARLARTPMGLLNLIKPILCASYPLARNSRVGVRSVSPPISSLY